MLAAGIGARAGAGRWCSGRESIPHKCCTVSGASVECCGERSEDFEGLYIMGWERKRCPMELGLYFEYA